MRDRDNPPRDIGKYPRPASDELIDRILRLAGSRGMLFAEIDGHDHTLTTDPDQHALLDRLAAAVDRNLGKSDRSMNGLVAHFDDVRDAIVAALEGAADELRLTVHAPADDGRHGFGDGNADEGVLHPAPPVGGTGHGGQVLLTPAACEAVDGVLPRGAALVQVGHGLTESLTLKPIMGLEHPDLPSEFPPVQAEGRPAGGLPTYGTPIRGRDAELRSILPKLGPGRFVTLIGPPGIGKTRLAVELARLTDSHAFPDGVRFCDASTLDEGNDLLERLVTVVERPAAIVERLYGRRPAGEPRHDVHDQARATVKHRRLLLILDDGDRLGSGAKLALADLLDNDGWQATVLATGRDPVGIPGEETEPVGPLAEPDGEPPVEASSDDAFGPGARDLVVRRLRAVPLAHELAAPLIEALGADEVTDRLAPYLPPGDPTPDLVVAATVDLAIEVLGDEEQRLFAVLSTLAGAWAVEDAQALAPAFDVEPRAVAGLLTELRRRALVHVDVTEGGGLARFRMLDAVRAHAARRLDRSDRAEAAAAAHAGHFLRLVATAEPARHTPSEPAWVRAVDAAFDNIRVAYRWFLDAGRLDDALALVWGLADDVLMRLRHDVGRWAETLADDPRTDGHRMRTAMCGLASNTAFVEGRLDRAGELVRDGRAASRPDSPGLWILFNTAALLAAAAGDEDRASDLLQEAAVTSSSDSPEPLVVVTVLYEAVLLHWLAGRSEQAAQFAGALDAVVSVVAKRPSFQAMAALARGLASSADPEAAGRHLRRGMNLAALARCPLLYLHGSRELGVNLLGTAASFLDRQNVSEFAQTMLELGLQAHAVGDLELAATIDGYLRQSSLRQTVLRQQLERRLRDEVVPDAIRSALERAGDEGAAMTPRQLEAHARAAIEGGAAA